MVATVPYTKGTHEIAEGVWAYLQPDGGWGRANAGLIASRDQSTSLLVDTLFDLQHTAEMLEALRQATPAAERIETVVNTHGDGDHCYGNALLTGAEFIASVGCAQQMTQQPPAQLAELERSAPEMGEAGRFLLDVLGPYELDGIELTLPSRTFTGELDIHVGDRLVRLMEVGPAHTAGDVVVHVPDAGVLFTGDIVFNGGHPIVWSGPVSNWIAACGRLLALEQAETVVPGHGPVSGRAAIADLRGYLLHLTTEAGGCLAAGMSPLEAADRIDLGPYQHLRQPERLVANINAIYRDLGADVSTDFGTVFGLMAQSRRA